MLLGVSCMLMTSSLFAQDVRIMYQSKLGTGGVDTVLVYMRSHKPVTQDIAAVNFSFAFQNSCLAFQSNNDNVFLAAWTNFLENGQVITILPTTYQGNIYDKRYQYGNSNGFIGFYPIITLPDSNSSPMLVMKVAFSGTCASLVYMENENENPFNQIADENLFAIPYIIENILNQPLIASWKGFQANKREEDVLLNWRTQDMQGLYYEVEKSYVRDFSSPISLGQVEVVGNGLGDRSYSFTDETNLRSIQYYRLKLLHVDGTHEYSPIIHLKTDDFVPEVSVYPNPVKDWLNVRASMLEDPIQAVTLYDAQGKEVLHKKMDPHPTYKIHVEDLSKGIYIVEALRISGEVTRLQVFKH